MPAPLIIETPGRVAVALADRKAELKPDKGITILERKDEDARGLEQGVARFTVESPAGYLHLTEVEPGLYALSMGDAPLVEEAAGNAAPMDMDDHLATIDALVKERDALASDKTALVAQVTSLGAVPVKPVVIKSVVEEVAL
jgi:hypothetical protein